MTWDDQKFAQRGLAGDPWVSLAALSSDLWILGQETSEVWSPSGVAALPLAPRPGSVVPFGCAAPLSPKAVAGTLCWLAQTREGSGYVVQATGLTPRIISTSALTTAIQGYPRIDDAIGSTYDDLNHVFYVLTFPTANATWVYDLTTETWCERGTWISELMRYDAWRPLFHAFCFDKHLVGDFRAPHVYELSTHFSTDVEARPIRRVRRAPALYAEHQRLLVYEFELLLQPGLGLPVGQGSEATVSLAWSRDGGQTFGPERWRSAGPIGHYQQRVSWDRNGSARDLVPEIVMTDPIPWRIEGARARVQGATT